MNMKKILIALSAAAAFAGCSSKSDPKPNTPSNSATIDMAAAKKCFEAKREHEVAVDEKKYGISDNVAEKKKEKDQACGNDNKANAYKWQDQNGEQAKKFLKDKPKVTERIEECYVRGRLTEEAWKLTQQYLVPGVTAKLIEAQNSLKECAELFTEDSKWRNVFEAQIEEVKSRDSVQKTLDERKLEQKKYFAKSLTDQDKEILLKCYISAGKFRSGDEISQNNMDNHSDCVDQSKKDEKKNSDGTPRAYGR